MASHGAKTPMGSQRTNHIKNSKLEPLKKWATQIAADMIQRVFVEFEREAGLAFDEVAQMRAELVRVSELLEGQMRREKELHALMESLRNQHDALAGHAMQGANSKTAHDLQHLHQMLDQLVQQASHQDGQADQTMAKLQHALAQADGHSSHAKNLKEQSITTEHELARIKQLLAMPNPNQPPPSMSMGGSPAGAYGSYSSVPATGYGMPGTMPMQSSMSMGGLPQTSGTYR